MNFRGLVITNSLAGSLIEWYSWCEAKCREPWQSITIMKCEVNRCGDSFYNSREIEMRNYMRKTGLAHLKPIHEIDGQIMVNEP